MAVDGNTESGSDVLSRVEQLCSDRGLRMTEPRRVIARVLSGTDDHPDVEGLYQKVKLVDSSISLATVYRTMKLFEELSIVSKRDFGDGRARYEQLEGPDDHHHHMIDIESGEVIEFFNQELEDLKVKIAQELGFELIDHQLELFGVRLKDKRK